MNKKGTSSDMTDLAAESVFSADTDEGLIRAVLAGDRDRYQELVVRHEGMVFGMILRQVGNRTVAEEITQDAFVRAYFGLNRFKFDSRFSTWLVRIALNRVSDYFSSKNYRTQQRSEDLDSAVSKSSEHTPDSLFEKQEFAKKLQGALARLKPKFRDTFVLCALEDRPYEEVAEILEVPVGTVRSRLNTARTQVKQALIKIYGEPNE